MPLSPRQAIELFHLVFLRALVAKNEDRALVSLKGGCNLRFYFGSVRYSEDIDFDAVVISKDTLKNKVDRLLRSPMVSAPQAIEHAMGVSFADYVAKVVAYLEPTQAEVFASRETWNAMQDEVVARLEGWR